MSGDNMMSGGKMSGEAKISPDKMGGKMSGENKMCGDGKTVATDKMSGHKYLTNGNALGPGKNDEHQTPNRKYLRAQPERWHVGRPGS